MGKPSSSHHSTSSHSLSTNTSREKMNASFNSQKSVRKKRERKNRTNDNIQKLFENLRNQSTISINDTTNCVSPNNTVVQNVITDSSCIILNDSIPQNQIPPKACSTPIPNKRRPSLDDLILTSYRKALVAPELTDNIVNLTKDYNSQSYLTIDLTTESDGTRVNNTVINIDDTPDTQDCTLISVSNASQSISGESDVTVLNNNVPQKKPGNKMRKFAKGIANLNAVEKGQLLELITQKIFSGCSVPNNVKNSITNIQQSTRATETVEDTFIKDMMLGQKTSRNSIGSNIYHPGNDKTKTGLRMIVIDGSNVSMEHGKGREFSVKGLKICIDYFLNRGHTVKAFVPRFRCKFGKSTEPRLLDYLERQGLVIYTPSREIKGKLITSYDDRYIVQCAAEFDAVIVSGDNYRDLHRENPRWQFVIENRLLPFTWVNDMIMFPRDPLGRNGPTLDQFLRHTPRDPPKKLWYE